MVTVKHVDVRCPYCGRNQTRCYKKQIIEGIGKIRWYHECLKCGRTFKSMIDSSEEKRLETETVQNYAEKVNAETPVKPADPRQKKKKSL